MKKKMDITSVILGIFISFILIVFLLSLIFSGQINVKPEDINKALEAAGKAAE